MASWELKLFFPQREDGDMQEQLGLRTQKDQDVTFGAVAAIAVGSVVLSSVIEGSALPPDLKERVELPFLVAPFLALLGSVAAPEAGTVLLRLDPRYRRRQRFHEAGHFLVGHLLGLEIESYIATPTNGAGSAVSFVTPTAGASPTHETLDGLAVLSMAGIAGEVVACGDAQGGYSDVAALRELCRRAEPPLASRAAQDERIRWATLMALTMLQTHRPSLEALSAQFEAGGGVEGCIEAIERAANIPTSPS